MVSEIVIKGKRCTYHICAPSHYHSYPLGEIELIVHDEIHIFIIKLDTFTELLKKKLYSNI